METKKYTFLLSHGEHEELVSMSESKNISPKEVIKKSLMLAFIASEIEADPNKHLIIRDVHGEEGDGTELTLF